MVRVIRVGFVALAPAFVWPEPSIICNTDPDARNFGTIEVTGLPEDLLLELRVLKPRAPEWSRLLTVHTSVEPTTPDQPAVIGRYRIEGSRLRFTPRFPLLPGVSYRVALKGAVAPGLPAVCSLPDSPVRDRTVVEAIYPSASEVPENLLRLYIYFSGPMRGKDAHRSVRLLDSRAQEVELAFVEVKEGLWDPGRRRLTLVFHPGRIKRGVGPNQTLGPPLRAGETFRIVVDSQLRDVAGEPLAASFEKELRVTPADRRSPDPRQWRIVPPRDPSGSLTLLFGEPLDHALAERLIEIQNAAGERVHGRLSVGEGETTASFQPRGIWQDGSYAVVVDPALEDVAGNRIDRLFDEKPSRTPRDARTTTPLRLPFAVEGS